MSIHRRVLIHRIALAAIAVLVAACGSSAPQSMAIGQRPTATASPAPAASPSASPMPSPSPTATPQPTATPLPNGIADLTGMHVPDALAHRLPIAVLIDDNRVARPQSGFNGASLVYQAPADGGETRYMMVFQEGESRDIGPVRSGRLYFVHWAAEVRAAVAHYGGDRQTLSWIRWSNGLVTNLDALAGSGAAFHRIKTRKAPHNAYTSTGALRKMIAKKGGPATLAASIHRRPFVDESPLDARGIRQAIRVPYQTGVVTYDYDRASNLYRRSIDGRAQIDPADGKRVTTRNVVVLFQKYRIDTTLEAGHSRPVIDDIGKGTAWIFSEGRFTSATWVKPSIEATTRLVDSAGKELPLVRGRTFFQIVNVGAKVTHS
jgi:DUF3048 family protein